MTQAQHVPTTSWSPLPVAMAALALTATFSVAVILTQLGPATIDVSPDRVSVTATAAERAWEAQRLQVSASTFAITATPAERAWMHQHLQGVGSAAAATAAERAWEAQRSQVSEATYGAATGDVSGNLHSEYLIELFRRQAAAAAGADLEGNLHSEYLIELFRRQAAAAETADDAPVEASSPRAPIAR